MTREVILNMEAGRELDMLVAEKLFKLEAGIENDWAFISPNKESKVLVRTSLPPYSSNIFYAWQVVEEVLETEWTFNTMSSKKDLGFGYSHYVEFKTVGYITSQASESSLPLAICKAALLTTLEE